jgi:hypothetical protein
MEKLPHYNFSWIVSLQNFGRGYGPVARQTNTSSIFSRLTAVWTISTSLSNGPAILYEK